MGAPYYKYSLIGPKTLFQLLRPLFNPGRPFLTYEIPQEVPTKHTGQLYKARWKA